MSEVHPRMNMGILQNRGKQGFSEAMPKSVEKHTTVVHIAEDLYY